MLQKLIEDKIPFSIISYKGLFGRRDMFIVMHLFDYEKYYRNADMHHGRCVAVDLTEKEKEFFNKNISEYFTIYKSGIYKVNKEKISCTIYERKNRSLSAYLMEQEQYLSAYS